MLSGGQYSGWLNDFFPAFDPATHTLATGVTPLTNNRFNSRQDLIDWVQNYLPTNGAQDYTWILPYLTHFSYDTDAPTFSPDPNQAP